MNRDASPPVLIGYGALYLDRGERMAKVQPQLDSIRAMAREGKVVVIGFGFDILFKQGQKRMAERYAKEVEDAIHDTFADYPGPFDVVVAAERVPSAGNDGTRPAREWATTKNRDEREIKLVQLRGQTEQYIDTPGDDR